MINIYEYLISKKTKEYDPTKIKVGDKCLIVSWYSDKWICGVMEISKVTDTQIFYTLQKANDMVFDIYEPTEKDLEKMNGIPCYAVDKWKNSSQNIMSAVFTPENSRKILDEQLNNPTKAYYWYGCKFDWNGFGVGRHYGKMKSSEKAAKIQEMIDALK